MYRDGLLESLAATIRSGDTDYTASELGIPGLRHFIYKARAHVQITYPVFEDPYDDVTEQRRQMPSPVIPGPNTYSVAQAFYIVPNPS